MNEAEQMLSDSTSHHAEHQVELLRTPDGDLRENLAALGECAGRTLAAGVRQTDRLIRENPYRSLAIAVGVGWLFSLALARSRR